MNTHSIYFYGELEKIIIELPSKTHLYPSGSLKRVSIIYKYQIYEDTMHFLYAV